jgi:hypothetical protein
VDVIAGVTELAKFSRPDSMQRAALAASAHPPAA